MSIKSQYRHNIIVTQIGSAYKGFVLVSFQFIKPVAYQLCPYFVAYSEEVKRQMFAVVMGGNRMAIIIEPRTKRLKEDMTVRCFNNVPYFVIVWPIVFQAFPE